MEDNMSLIEILLASILGTILYFGIRCTLYFEDINNNLERINTKLKETNNLLERIRSLIYNRI